MKPLNEAVPERRGPYRTCRALVLAMAAALPSCIFFDDRVLPLDEFRYDVHTTIQSVEGIRSRVSTDNLGQFAGDLEQPKFAHFASMGGQAGAREQWLRYLGRILDARAGDEAFVAQYGRGPWCVAGEPNFDGTHDLLEPDDERLAHEEGEPLVLCPCGERCGNPSGVYPELTVSPVAAGEPYTVEFGEVPVGTSVAREVTVSNSGAGRLCLNEPVVHGTSENPGDFSVVPLAGCTASPEGVIVLEGAATCRFRATFTPTQPGTRRASVPRERGCGEFITLTGRGLGGTLSASPSPVCFPGPVPPCQEMAIRIANTGMANVTLISTSLTGEGPNAWQFSGLENGAGEPIDLTVEPHSLGPGEFATAHIAACELATSESALRVVHNGTDYGEEGSPTGDVDSGSPLTVRLLPPGCTS